MPHDWHAERRRPAVDGQSPFSTLKQLPARDLELTERPGGSEQFQAAARAARAAIDNAVAAHRALAERFESSAIAPDDVAGAHDQAAALGQLHAAETHSAAARQDRTVAAQLRGGRSPLRLTASAVRDIRVLTVDGVLDDTSYIPLRDAIVKAALDEPRAVIIDVTRLVVREDPAWAVFTSARWQITEWPDTPVGLVCAHNRGRNALRRNGITRDVPVYPTLKSAVTELPTEGPRRYRRRVRASLPAMKSSSQRCRELTAQWLTEWSRSDFIHAVSIVATELVEIALTNTDSAISLRLETGGCTVAVAVQYVGAALPTGRHSTGGNFSSLDLVAATSRVWGSYTAAAGNTVWAVLGPENRF
jgi:hypothetical protein